VTNAWKTTTLADEIELAYGKSLPGHLRCPGSAQVFGSNGIVGTHTSGCVEGPGIIIGRKGSVGEVAFSKEDFWPIDTTYFVKNTGQHNWRYLFHLLSSLELTGLNSHSAVPGLNRDDVYSIRVRIPEATVQKDIATVLDFVATKVESEQKAIIMCSSAKMATMRKLFAKGLRGETQKETEIGLVPASWDVRRFESVREWLQYGTSVQCDSKRSTYPVLRIPNVEAAFVNVKDLKYCDLPPEVAERYQLVNGDLLFIRTNGVRERLGKCAVYAGDPKGALFASYLIRARILLEELVPRYAAYFFSSELGTELVAGGATPAADGKFNLNTGAINSILLPVPPSLDEQEDIVEILEAIDRKIALHRSKMTILEGIFQTLLHKLITGELHVSELDLSALETAHAVEVTV